MTIEIYPGVSVPAIGTVPLERLANDGGLKVLEDILAGVLPAPPIAPVLHFVMSEVVEEARVVFKGWPGTDHLDPLGTVYGGLDGDHHGFGARLRGDDDAAAGRG